MKTYPIVCHVCDAELEVHSDFLSLPASRLMPDGSMRGVGTCNMVTPNHHTGDEIRASWLKRRGVSSTY